VPFPGYSVASLSGETLGIASLAYRFPIQTHIGRSLGPLHVDALYAQLSGTFGNVWGYGEAADGTAIREKPGDAAARNSVDGAKALGEAGLELRMQSSLFNRYRWTGLARLGYAFVPAGGLGDVDGDGIYPGVYGDVVPVAGGEIDPGGINLTIGLGLGF